ncbi:MAG TPA: hypothetical protein VK444_07810 [Methanobacteriaceae archaeon]|nr:hypothetical protein [Methanobacteriaceae archaeon]
MEKENNSTITTNNSQKKLEIIRRHVEEVFLKYEKIKPPSNYRPLYLRILKLVTSLQETVVVNQNYLESALPADLKESKRLLEEFRQEFRLVKSEIEKDLK